MLRLKLSLRGIFTLLLTWLFTSCAGSSSGGLATSTYLADLGVTTSIGFKLEAERILLRKHQYSTQIFEESLDRAYLETTWKNRLPFDDERAAGVVQAKSRIILEGRSRLRASGGATIKVKFKGENQLLYQNSDSWEYGGEITPLCREYFKQLANDIKTEFSTRVREL